MPSCNKKFMAQLFMETAGTMLLCYAATYWFHGAKGAAADMSRLILGFVVVGLTYMGGPLSGAHFNPATTLAMMVTGDIDMCRWLLYTLMQLVGGATAVMIHYGMVSLADHDHSTTTTLERAYYNGLPHQAEGSTLATWFISEELATFFLVYTVLHVSCPKVIAGNNYYGIAIGVVYMGCSLYGLPGFINPAVTLANVLHSLLYPEDEVAFLGHLVAVGGQYVGAIVAALFFRFLTNPDLYQDPRKERV